MFFFKPALYVITFIDSDHSSHLLSLKSSFFVAMVVVGFVALRPKSTAMVIAGRSVHLTTLFPGQA